MTLNQNRFVNIFDTKFAFLLKIAYNIFIMEELKYPNNIAVIRRMLRLSQAYVSEQIGVSRPKYIEIERGMKDITLTQLKKLKETLGAETEDLVGVDTGRFDYRDFIKKSSLPEAIKKLKVRTVWDSENKEWLVPVDEIKKYII